MISKEEMDRIDSQGMYKIYDKWPEIANKYYNSDFESIESTGIDHIVFSGMGGSGSINDIFSSIFSKTDIRISLIKGYELPKSVNQKTLVVSTSVSGNSVETLAILKSAKNKKCKNIGFASGGLMEKFCLKNSIEFRKISMYQNPRSSFPSFLYGMLKTLQEILPLKKTDVISSIKSIKSLSKEISSDNLTENNSAINMAKWITEIPVIYYPYGLQSVAIRFKNSLQENTKEHAMVENIIEASHNGIVSWEGNKKLKPILIRGKDDHKRTKQRWEIFKQYFNENKIDFYELSSVNGNILTKSINLIYLLDYASIYLSILKKTNPSPVDSINFIRTRL